MAGYATGMSSAVDFFMKVDGIEGESLDDKHKGEIQLLSFSLGATQAGTAGIGGGSGSGKVQLHDFQITKYFDKSSPKLFEACATGAHTAKVVVVCRKAGGAQQEYLKYTFSEVLVSSITHTGSGSDVLPTENVSLNYSKIEIEYKGQDEKGNLTGVVKGGWDAAKNTKV